MKRVLKSALSNQAPPFSFTIFNMIRETVLMVRWIKGALGFN